MKVAFLTAGGLAPCLSATIARLTKNYFENYNNIQIIGYLYGYKGLLLGKSVSIPKSIIHNIDNTYQFGGSPLGNSRVKLTNIDDCVKKGYIKKGQNPLEVAANQLKKDNIKILHTIGGDDTNSTAADLSFYLKKNNYNLTVVGLPKTIDNDIYPIKQTLGGWTAAEQGAIFFENIINENTTSEKQLIIHEIMGRNCGWLTAATALKYRERLSKKKFVKELGITKEKWDIHAILLPEDKINFQEEIKRLNKIMKKNDCVNIFLSEGAGIDIIIKETEKAGFKINRDAFGHVLLDELNAGVWFAKEFGRKLNANKILIQKSGYFARSAKANQQDLSLIFEMADFAIKSALKGHNGVIGHDEENSNKLSCINFNRIRGGKPFDISSNWYQNMLNEIKKI
ncbi:MAG: pyrophosphate--fructose-6-phosphate 1-phosphotransferase [Bacteroidota bacterium]|nr:pyrophosphate--fructose-6-phosphate 1-phosphotransferase [Bacteroidota bacterium]